MPRQTNWENQIGRRLRLRDLHVLFAVAQRGSMAKAATELGISQPAVSDVIANLEHAIGVRLFDRGPQGVEPTMYGRALLNRSVAALDELKQGIKDIEFLSDPTGGEVRIGCGATLSASLLPAIVHRFSQQYPRAVLQVKQVPPPTRDVSGLRHREHDLILGRWVTFGPLQSPEDDLNVEFLCDDPLVVAVGAQSRWPRRQKIDIADLAGESWILTPPNSWNYMGVAEAFQARGLQMPKIGVMTSSIDICAHLLADGEFVTAQAKSLADQRSLKILPVDLPARPWPVAIVALKNRTLPPVAERFIQCAREVAKALTSRNQTK